MNQIRLRSRLRLIAVEGENGFDRFAVNDGVDHIAVDFFLAGFECAEDASRASLATIVVALGWMAVRRARRRRV